MNAAGIPVFYGALAADTAIAEVRPSVGGLVIVGRFSVSRPQRLLDFTRMGAGYSGSIFDAAYTERATRLRFLKQFHSLIARPVQPDDEPLAYLPTQAVAEYVANVLGFDGMLYASAQIGAAPDDDESEVDYIPEPTIGEAGRCNVALFGPAGAVDVEGPEPSVIDESDANIALVDPSRPKSRRTGPGLTYEAGSATCQRVAAITYEHRRHFIFDPDEPSDF
jgi:hypothetical protein